jgi:hypothetical protein
MKAWTERPREIRNLFNPAFCGVVLLRGLMSFKDAQQEGMPFSLSLLVLPLSLHKASREAIIRGNRSYLTKIVDESPELLVGLPERARSMLPYSFEAFGLLMQQEAISVSTDGRISATHGCLRKQLFGTVESQACQQAAQILGRKFAAIGDRVTIYTTFGLRP